MKRVVFIILFIICSNFLHAQKIKVKESKENIGGGANNALSVIIYEASQERIEKEVKLLLKDYDAKVSSRSGGWLGDNATIKKIGNNTIDIYVKLENIKTGETNVVFAFDLGGAFLSSSNGKQYKVAKEILLDFATKTTHDAMAELVKAEEKKFDKLTEEEKKFEKENARLYTEIEDNKAKIEECNKKIKLAEDALLANQKSQELKKQDITVEQKVLSDSKEKQKRLQ